MPADVAQLELLASELKAAGGRIRREEKTVVAETTEKIADAARANAPVESGSLRDSITGTAKGLKGRVDASIRYAVFVEFGTSKMSPRSFMTPALEQSQGAFYTDALEAAARALEG